MMESKVMATLDLKNGYHQIPLHPDSYAIAGITVPMGLYEYKCLPQGYKNAPAIFQTFVHGVLNKAKKAGKIKTDDNYIDDILCGAQDLPSLKEEVEAMFEVLAAAGLNIEPLKCKFGVIKATYLGFTLSPNGKSVSNQIVERIEAKIEQILETVPKTDEDQLLVVQRVLGVLGFYRQFVRYYTEKTRFLTTKLRKGGERAFTEDEVKLIKTIVDEIKEAQPQPIIKQDKDVTVYTDASKHGAGYIAVQIQDDKSIKTVDMQSCGFTSKSIALCATDSEMACVMLAITKLSPLVPKNKLIIVTDHKPLLYLVKTSPESLDGRRARWVQKMNSTQIRLQYNKGAQQQIPDALSRLEEKYHDFIIDVVEGQNGPGPKWRRIMIGDKKMPPPAYAAVKRDLTACGDVEANPGPPVIINRGGQVYDMSDHVDAAYYNSIYGEEDEATLSEYAPIEVELSSWEKVDPEPEETIPLLGEGSQTNISQNNISQTNKDKNNEDGEQSSITTDNEVYTLEVDDGSTIRVQTQESIEESNKSIRKNTESINHTEQSIADSEESIRRNDKTIQNLREDLKSQRQAKYIKSLEKTLVQERKNNRISKSEANKQFDRGLKKGKETHEVLLKRLKASNKKIAIQTKEIEHLTKVREDLTKRLKTQKRHTTQISRQYEDQIKTQVNCTIRGSKRAEKLEKQLQQLSQPKEQQTDQQEESKLKRKKQESESNDDDEELRHKQKKKYYRQSTWTQPLVMHGWMMVIIMLAYIIGKTNGTVGEKKEHGWPPQRAESIY